MTGAIELSGIEKRYGALTALAGVSLSVARGEFTALVGGSGIGRASCRERVSKQV